MITLWSITEDGLPSRKYFLVFLLNLSYIGLTRVLALCLWFLWYLVFSFAQLNGCWRNQHALCDLTVDTKDMWEKIRWPPFLVPLSTSIIGKNTKPSTEGLQWDPAPSWFEHLVVSVTILRVTMLQDCLYYLGMGVRDVFKSRQLSSQLFSQKSCQGNCQVNCATNKFLQGNCQVNSFSKSFVQGNCQVNCVTKKILQGNCQVNYLVKTYLIFYVIYCDF